MLATQSYSAFGESRAATGSTNNGLKYTGRELDNDSGLYQYRARYYDPAVGRFISEDPKGFGAGVNFFAYVDNNPINANDPSGELANFAIGAIYGGISGIVGGGVSGYAASGKLIDAAKGAGLGLFAGAAIGSLTPWLSYEAGAAAAAIGVARTVGTVAATATVGGASSAVGQFAGNVVTGQSLGTNFSWGAAAGSAAGSVLATVPAKIAGSLAGTTVGTSIPFGSRSLTIVTPTVRRTAGVVGAFTEGSIGGIFEASGQAIESNYFPSTPQGASGGFLLYPNKANTNMIQSVYRK